MPRIRYGPVKLAAFRRSPRIPVPSSPPAQRSPWRYLRDHDIQHAAVVTLLAVLLSAGLVWLGYLIHVCRVAMRSPLIPPQRMVALVFGRRLEGDVPGHDYRQRLHRALVLAQQQYTDHVLLLGGGSGSRRSEAEAGRTWLRQHGLPAGMRVELEQDSVDSLENLRQARSLLLSQADGTALPPVALVTSRYHLARCLLLARRLGFDALPIAAEPALPRQWRYAGLLLVEASYLMWTDLGLRWATLIGHRRMSSRIS